MRRRLSKYLLHSLRIGLLLCIALLMRDKQQELLHTRPTSTVDVTVVQSVMPDAHSLRTASRPRQTDVLDERGNPLGYVLQTSPDADHIIGFSGPTNVLIAFSLDDQIQGLSVIASGDTRDHLRQVVADQAFLKSWNGLMRTQLDRAQIDAVSGATLTSLAIAESVSFRLGQEAKVSRRFPDPPTLPAAQIVYPSAASIHRTDTDGVFRVEDENGEILGRVLRTTPSADNIVGYQGPTEALVGIGPQNRVQGVGIGASYDNEPYVGYVRDDEYFRSLFNDRSIQELATMDLELAEVEGVSGATMTSMAVAQGIIAAARANLPSQQDEDTTSESLVSAVALHDVGAVLVVMGGMAIGLTRLRGNRRLAILWKCVLIGYLGLTAGCVLSQAMFVGWARYGVPWKSALGLVCMAVAALSLPVLTRNNLYCTHLCPHGAAQQLLRPLPQRQLRLGRRLKACFAVLLALLLLWCIVVGMSGLTFSLVDIEPFDAYLFRVAGWATLVVAVAGLVAARFVPMAYCRYGCPTGALLDFLRFNARADRWTMRDWIASGYLLVAVLLWWS